jgi:glutathione S-transferase
MWTIAELGLMPVRRFDVGHKYGGNDTPEFLAMNPNGTVPVLKDGEGEPLWETGAIIRYLASRYGVGAFWPTDLAKRAQIDKWAEWAKINITLNFSHPIFWPMMQTPPEKLDHARIAAALGRLTQKLAIAEKELTRHEFLAGHDFTLADIQMGHLLYRYYDLPLERADLPALARYYDGLTARPAYREHVMVPYDALRAG